MYLPGVRRASSKRSSAPRTLARGARADAPSAAPPVATRKADRVARDVLARIVSGELAPGSVLPREDELAAEYAVNRGVVREAVKLLEVHRLVRPVRRRGTVVLDPLGSMSPEVLVAMLAPRPGRVDRRVLGGFLEVRAILDAEMAQLAADRRTTAEIRAMRACLRQIEDELSNPQLHRERVFELTRLFARATKNPLFEMLAAYNARVATELDAAFSVTRAPSREHLAGLTILVDLIEKKDAAGARRLVEEFHAWARPRILAAAALASGEPLPRVAKEMER